jgi:hypothetical protein
MSEANEANEIKIQIVVSDGLNGVSVDVLRDVLEKPGAQRMLKVGLEGLLTGIMADWSGYSLPVRVEGKLFLSPKHV